MSVEMPRPAPLETPRQTFYKYSNDFAWQTWAASTLDGFRRSQAFKDIVSMGEEAIPLILEELERPTQRDYDSVIERCSPWLILALDDITGQGMIKKSYRKTRGDLDKMFESALQWAERKSYIEIRSKKELAKTGQELFVLLRNAILGNPASRLALGGERLTPRERQKIWPMFLLNTDEKEVIREFDFKGEQLYLEYSGDHYLMDGTISESLLLAYADPSDEDTYRKLYVAVTKQRGELSRAEFEFGTESNTRRAEANFRETVAQLFGPHPPQLKVA